MTTTKLRTKIINLWGGPGTGKSTCAAGLFHIMKTEGCSVELVTEFAKDLTWDERSKCLKDQFYISAKQNHKLERLRSKVEYIITDSPLLLGLVYDDKKYKNYPAFLREVFNSYENENFFLIRKKKYIPIGRNQTEDQARSIDGMILSLIASENIPTIHIDSGSDAPEEIFNIIK